jgi:hypothetical protein
MRLGLNLGLGSKQTTAAAGGGGGGSFDYSQYLTFTVDPAGTLYQTDAETSLVDTTGQNVVRAYPPLTPQSGDYLVDATTSPTWKAGADGINGNPTILVTASAQALITNAMVLNQVFSTSTVVLALCGKITTPPSSGTRQIFGDLFGASAVMKCNDGNVTAYLGAGVDYEKSAAYDGSGLFSLVMRWTGNVFDLWANGTKQSSTNTSGGITSTDIDTEKFYVVGGVGGGTTSVTWELLHGGAGATANVSDDDMAALAAQYETLLGR